MEYGLELDRTLVLNKGWQAIATVPVVRALKSVFRDRAKIVDTETFEMLSWADWLERKSVPHDAKVIGTAYIHTTRILIEKPAVITLSKYRGFPRAQVSFSRRALYDRDNGMCQYCGKHLSRGTRDENGSKEVTIDHVVPVSRGGQTTWENCVLSCLKCNHQKGDRSLEESGLILLKDPKQPTRTQSILKGVALHPEWSKFISKEIEEISISGKNES